MIRLAKNEYIRNFWFNLSIIVLATVMMVISVAMVSNIYAQSRLYRFAEKYINENTIFIDEVSAEAAEELNKYGTFTAVKKYDGRLEVNEFVNVLVYSDEAMKKLRPGLDMGKYPDKCKKGSDTICAMIGNGLVRMGISVGDEFELEIETKMNSTESGESIKLKFYAAGLITECQHMYMDRYSWSNNMTYEDFFPVYEDDGSNIVSIFIPESEEWKLPEEAVCKLNNIILNPYEKLSDEEKREVIYKLWDFSTMTSTPFYVNNADVIDISREIYENDMARNIPLCMVVLLLFVTGILGVVSVKTAVSIRSYGIMYIAGMSPAKAPLISGIEMGFNCIIAGVFTVSLLKIQQKLKITTAINFSINESEPVFIAAICLLLVAGAVLTTRSILKGNTLISIIRNRE